MSLSGAELSSQDKYEACLHQSFIELFEAFSTSSANEKKNVIEQRKT